MKPKSVAFALVVGAFLVSVAPAQAGKWSYGNGPTDLWTVHPVSAGPFDVCTTRVHGRVGLHGFGDPAGPPPAAPPLPYAPVTVNVYAGAPAVAERRDSRDRRAASVRVTHRHRAAAGRQHDDRGADRAEPPGAVRA